MKATTLLKVLWPVFLALLLAGNGVSYGASLEEIVKSLEGLPREQRFKKQVEGAKKEKKLVIYTSTQVGETQRRIDFFKEKYPFMTDVIYYRSSHHRLLSRLKTEYRTETYLADVVDMNGDILYLAKKERLLGKYLPTEWEAFAEGFRDPDGYWTAQNIRPLVLEYNTDLVAPQNVPKKLTDLLSPVWKGKLALDSQEYFWFANVLKVLGEGKGLEFMKKLASQNINFRRGHSLLSQLVAAGEFPVNLVQYAHISQRTIRAGAPIDWVGIDPIITDTHAIAVAAKPNNPYAAMLYVNLFLSEEGQTFLKKTGFIPARNNVEPDPPRLTRGLKLVPADVGLTDDILRYKELFQKVFSVK
jgi:iron(III) transport system substrate-binding protein